MSAPPPSRLARHVYRGSSMADLRVDCPAPKTRDRVSPGLRSGSEAPGAKTDRGQCRPPRGDGDLPRAAAVRRGTDTLGRAAARRRPDARPRGLDVNGGLGIVGTLADGKRHKEPPFRVVVSDVTLFARLARANLRGDLQGPDAGARHLHPAQSRLARQLGAALHHRGRPRLVASTAATFSHADRLPRPEFRCVCDVLRAKSFGAGPPRRRAMFALEVKRARPPFRSGAALVWAPRPATPARRWATAALDEDALAGCLSSIKTEVNEPELPVRFSVGADGHVKSHTATWPRTIPAGVRRCMDAVARPFPVQLPPDRCVDRGRQAAGVRRALSAAPAARSTGRGGRAGAGRST